MNALATAARRTLEEESARVTLRHFWHPPLENGLIGPSADGITDLRLKRTFVRVSDWDQVFRHVLELFPWLKSETASKTRRRSRGSSGR